MAIEISLIASSVAVCGMAGWLSSGGPIGAITGASSGVLLGITPVVERAASRWAKVVSQGSASALHSRD